ncbi:MAG: hypothetical protein V3U34_03605 [candidate division NC10 bacterium]
MTTELEIIVEYQRRRIDDLQGERARLGEQLDRLGEQVDRLQGLLEREQVLRQQAQGQLDRLAERLTLPAPELDVVIGNAILPNSGEVKFPTPSW